MQFHIRLATMQDSPQLFKILKQTQWFDFLNQDDENFVSDNVAALLNDCLENPFSHTIFVAVNSENLAVGYVSVHWLPYLFMSGPEGFVSELFVSPENRGVGIGSALLNEVKKEGALRGCNRLSLLNGKHRESYNRGFYTTQGWEERPLMVNFIYPM
jgi:GNAT superfamily N-acetyltransferase